MLSTVLNTLVQWHFLRLQLFYDILVGYKNTKYYVQELQYGSLI